jgi:hypothetical protein
MKAVGLSFVCAACSTVDSAGRVTVRRGKGVEARRHDAANLKEHLRTHRTESVELCFRALVEGEGKGLLRIVDAGSMEVRWADLEATLMAALVANLDEEALEDGRRLLMS